MYVHSSPNNNDNQDIVSMGCNAALITKKVIDNSFEVIAIQAVTIMQAIDYLECVPRLSPNTQAIYKEVRKIFPKFIEDQPRYKEMEKLKSYFEKASPVINLSPATASQNGTAVKS